MASFDHTLGVLYNSVTISAALYGAGIVQAWFYYRKYSQRDGWIIKTLVGTLVILDTCQEATLAACVYKYGVTNFGNPAILGTVINTLIIEIYFSNFIAIIVQMFYCYRIWKIRRNWIFAAPSFLVSWASFIALMVYCCKAVSYRTIAELATIDVLSKTCNILAAAADVIISATLILILQSMKTGYQRSTDMINRLVVFTFNTGIPTSFCAIMACVSISAWPSTFWYMLFFLQMGRLYTNSFFVMLNSREYIYHASESGVESTGFNLSVRGNVHMSSANDAHSRFTNSKHGEIAVRIGTLKETFVDNDDELAKDVSSTRPGSETSKKSHNVV